MHNPNLPVDNQHIDDIEPAKIYYFKREPFYMKNDKPMTDEEVEIEVDTLEADSSKVVLYEEGQPVGVEILWKERDL